MSDKLQPPFLIDVAKQARQVQWDSLDEMHQRMLLRHVGQRGDDDSVLRIWIRPIFLTNKPQDKRWRRRHSFSAIDRIQVQVLAAWPDVQIQGYAPRTRPVSLEGADIEYSAAFELFGFSLSGKVKQELQRREPRFDILTAWHASGALQWVFAERFVRNQEEIVLDLLVNMPSRAERQPPPLRVDTAYLDGNRIVQSVTNKQVFI